MGIATVSWINDVAVPYLELHEKQGESRSHTVMNCKKHNCAEGRLALFIVCCIGLYQFTRQLLAEMETRGRKCVTF